MRNLRHSGTEIPIGTQLAPPLLAAGTAVAGGWTLLTWARSAPESVVHDLGVPARALVCLGAGAVTGMLAWRRARYVVMLSAAACLAAIWATRLRIDIAGCSAVVALLTLVGALRKPLSGAVLDATTRAAATCAGWAAAIALALVGGSFALGLPWISTALQAATLSVLLAIPAAIRDHRTAKWLALVRAGSVPKWRTVPHMRTLPVVPARLLLAQPLLQGDAFAEMLVRDTTDATYRDAPGEPRVVAYVPPAGASNATARSFLGALAFVTGAMLLYAAAVWGTAFLAMASGRVTVR